jgi:hypothetical protein
MGYRSSGFAGLGPVLAGHGFEITAGALHWFHTRRSVTFEGAYRYTSHGPLIFTTGRNGVPPDAVYEEYAATYHTFLLRGYYTFLFPMRHTPHLQWRWGLVLGANLGLHWQQLDLRTRGTQANPVTINQNRDRFLLAMPFYTGLVLHWNQYRRNEAFQPLKPSKQHWSYSKRDKKKKPRRVLD